ncbi:hypothetical protein LTR36_005892 [Oleoguttula mirabilis]|uniref:CRIB domain-containing protein n=1 Tax=Oleoguttula mirabilis TaxID=1507867 RepID=A0AAV9JDC4_9PEZI|nr:hypothetical protein LTR36_005892 [Oleoguttula mirabilis]
MSSQSKEAQLPSRPATALGETRRRKTEPLESIRNSIFGGRKKSSPPNSRGKSASYVSRPSSRSSDTETTELPLQREHFRFQEDYYRYLRKLSISPPFNFEHVTHTAKKQLSPLETVDEQELTAEFWAVAAYQKPRRRLNGIKADNLSEKLPAMGVERGAPSSRPTSPVPAEPPIDRPHFYGSIDQAKSVDETMFDEAKDTNFDPDAALERFHSTEQPTRHPRRYSSLTALNERRLRFLQQEPPPTLSESHRSSESDAPGDHTQHASTQLAGYASALDDVAEERDSSSLRRISEHVDRAKQPLPALPPQTVPKKSSRSSLRPSNPATPSIASIVSTDRRSSVMSKRSSRSTYKSPAISSTPASNETRRPSVLSDATWEDDVDFCYQQEAESTCDFDWQSYIPARESSIAESDGGVRLSAWLDLSPPAEYENPRARQQPVSADVATKNAYPELHRRGSSVGHRGFLAARKGSCELLQKKSLTPPALRHPSGPAPMSILSPVLSVTGADEDAPKVPYPPGTLHFPGFDGANRASAEYLSDPESVRTGGSKHSKSSSYGSYDSIARPAPATADKTRWSMASSSSIPDLLHSKRRSKPSVHKSMISRPLESLPQSPGAECNGGAEEESTIVPRATQIEPMRNTFVMRRPQSPRETAVLQSAGRAVQRSRPPTPSRFSRLLHVEGSRQLAATPAPGWI